MHAAGPCGVDLQCASVRLAAATAHAEASRSELVRRDAADTNHKTRGCHLAAEQSEMGQIKYHLDSCGLACLYRG